MRALTFEVVVVGLGMLSMSARAADGTDSAEAQEPPPPPVVTPAQETPPTVVAPAQVPIALAPAEAPVPLLDERTAYMIGRHRLKLGILAFEFGITKWLSVGSDPPAWALRSVAKVWVPNLHVKLQLLDRDPVAVAVLAGAYYAFLDGGDSSSGHIIDVPLSLFASVRVHPRIYLHGEGTYVAVRAYGAGNVSQTEVNGAAAARAGQAGLMLQFRLTRIFSVTATGRYQFYTDDVPFRGSGSLDPFTTATVSGQVVPPIQHPWEAIGGIAALWRHFRLIAGVGYGYYFVPGLAIPNTEKTIVPDLSLSVLL
jgi:hypothetical protein